MNVKDEPDKIKVYSLKARHGPSKQTRELRVDPARCRIMSGSVDEDLIQDTDFDIEKVVDDIVKPGIVDWAGASDLEDMDDDLSEMG